MYKRQAYSRLGIGRLIYQLPLPLCKMFIKEIFDGRSPDEFDEETLQTINKFFENNLNVSETSRQLYICLLYTSCSNNGNRSRNITATAGGRTFTKNLLS